MPDLPTVPSFLSEPGPLIRAGLARARIEPGRAGLGPSQNSGLRVGPSPNSGFSAKLIWFNISDQV
jgi:hypothetical protein